MIFDPHVDHKTSTIKIMLIATTVACHIVTSIEDFGTLSSCFLYCSYYDVMSLELLCLLSAPALKRLLTFCVARFQSFFLFCELFKFVGHVCRSGQLVTLGFSTGIVFTKLGVSAPCSNPQPRRPGALLLGLPFLSSDDPTLRCQIFALTPTPLLGARIC